jgi:hypothetical protein
MSVIRLAAMGMKTGDKPSMRAPKAALRRWIPQRVRMEWKSQTVKNAETRVDRRATVNEKPKTRMKRALQGTCHPSIAVAHPLYTK